MLPLIVLSLLGGWQVEETPLAPPPWEVDSVTPIDGDSLGVIARIKPDAGTPEWGVFVARGGATPILLRRFTTEARETGENGTGFTLQVGEELFRVRLGAQPTLVALTNLTDVKAIRGVTCDDQVTDCVITFHGHGPAQRWRGEVSRLYSLPEDDSAYDLEAWGAAMNPDGGVVALGLSGSAALMTLGTGKVTVVRGAMTLSRNSLAELAAELAAQPKLRTKWDAAGQRCNTIPLGWRGGSAHVANQAFNEIGAQDCDVKPLEFELDPATGKRKAIAAYPWSVLKCPRGGWTSKVGTMITDCDDPEAAERRMKLPPQKFRPSAHPDLEVEPGEVTPPQKGEPPNKVLPPPQKANELPYPRELPEAVALSENEIFVMEPLEKHPYTWFRGPPKGKGLTFIVDGPSVLRFEPKGVVVESVPTWRFGTSIFEESLGDDWHLIRTDEDKFALVRLSETQ